MSEFRQFLQTFCQKNNIELPQYEVRPTGIKNRVRFLCEVRVSGYNYIAVGNSTNKKDSQNNAARDFLNFLVREGIVPVESLPGHDPVAHVVAPAPDQPDGNVPQRSVFGDGEDPNKMGQAYKAMGPNDFYLQRAQAQEDKVEQAEDLDINSRIHGNWTIDNAKSKLHQYLQTNKIKADYVYTMMGPDHVRTMTALMSIYVPQLGRNVTGRGDGSSKLIASKTCALSIVRQLFHFGVIEEFSGTLKKNKSVNDLITPYKVNISPALRFKVQDCLRTLNISVPAIPTTESQEAISLLCEKVLKNETGNDNAKEDVIAWSPPSPNWNAWIGCNIDEGYLATATLETLSDELARENRERMMNIEELKKSVEERSKLLVYQSRTVIMEAIHNNPVVIIQGNTGCGKTTQVCQYILDDYIASGQGAFCNILITQPRRISAVSLSERVANERCENIGQSIGYTVRFDSVLPRPYGSILFCTVGVLLKKLEGGLRGVSHVIVDEIHERDINTDFILVILRDMVHTFPDLRVILMSATIDISLFANYFNKCPIIEISGETYPVTQYFIEDAIELTKFFPSPSNKRKREADDDSYQDAQEVDLNIGSNLGPEYSEQTKHILTIMGEADISFELIEAVLKHIREKALIGAVLIFLPGWSLIHAVMKHLQSSPIYGGPNYYILPLHSQLPREEQRNVFLPVPPHVTKIILTTNIAESSITINDIVAVIDSCKSKLKVFTAHNNMTTYATVWASKTNLEQRRGRAGRVRPGLCFHLCTRSRYNLLDENIAPEMLRSPLHEIALTIKLLRLGGIGHFLSKAIEPPPIDTVIEAEVLLREMKCLDEQNVLTPLGKILARLAIEPRLGKMMVLGCIFNVGGPLATMAANSSTFPEIFTLFGGQTRISFHQKALCGVRSSDHVAMLAAYGMWDNARQEGTEAESSFCDYKGINMMTMRVTWEAKRQLHSTLINAGFPAETLDFQYLNTVGPDSKLDLIMALMCFGLYPNVCYHVEKRKVLTTEGKSALIYRTSVNCSNLHQVFKFPFFVFGEKLRTRAVSCKQMSMVTALHLMLFGSRKVDWINGSVRLDNWINLDMDPNVAAEIVALRPAVENLVTKYAETPEHILNKPAEDQMLIDTISELCIVEAGDCDIVRPEIQEPRVNQFGKRPATGREFNGPPPKFSHDYRRGHQFGHRFPGHHSYRGRSRGFRRTF